MEKMAIDTEELLNPTTDNTALDPPLNIASRKADWNYTKDSLERVAHFIATEGRPDGKLEKVGYYEGRRLIGRDRPIDEGVYVTAGWGDAIVVDGKRYPHLRNEYDKLKTELQEISIEENRSLKSYVLGGVYERARKLLKFDLKAVAKLNKSLGIPQKTDKPVKVSLGAYLRNGVGVCRHQALLAGYFLEQFKKDGIVQGTVSVDRNWVEGIGGHAWVRYVNSVGTVFIIDPAQKYIGKLNDIKPGKQWFYNRTQDP